MFKNGFIFLPRAVHRAKKANACFYLNFSLVIEAHISHHATCTDISACTKMFSRASRALHIAKTCQRGYQCLTRSRCLHLWDMEPQTQQYQHHMLSNHCFTAVDLKLPRHTWGLGFAIFLTVLTV